MNPIDNMTPDQMREALGAMFRILYMEPAAGGEYGDPPVVNAGKEWDSDTFAELSTWAADFGIAPDEEDGIDEVLANERNYPSADEVL